MDSPDKGWSETPSAQPARGSASRPLPLTILVGVLAIEIVALAIVGVVAGIEIFRPNATVGADIFFLVLAWGIAALLAKCARGLQRGERWSRSPVMTWQLFQIVIAVTWLTTAVHIGGILLLAASAAVIVTLMTPTVVAHTTRDAHTPNES